MKHLLLVLCWFLLTVFAYGQVPDSTQTRDTLTSEIIGNIQDNLPTVTLNDEDLEEGGSFDVSSILTSGRDPFLSAAAFNFSPMRFRLRGYPNADAMYLNGVEFSGLDNGFTPFGLWTGLTNVMRSRQNAYGLDPADFGFGFAGLNTNVDMRAGAQWAQTQIGYGASNRNFRHRLLITHGSGYNAKGWAYAFMLSPRYGGEGFIPGTYMRSLSYYAAVDKKLGSKNTLSLIAFGAPSENGRQAASVQEAMDLAGSNYYNPSWGWQDGKKRNSNVVTTFQPAFLGVYEHQPDIKSSWTITAAYVSGKRKQSGFDWYNTSDPRPDYYRYLPSYYNHSAPGKAAAVRAAIIASPDLLQVNWEQLYDANRNNPATVNNVDGIAGNQVSGSRSVYILSNRVNDLMRYMLSSRYHTKVNNWLSLTGGINYQQQTNHYYLEVDDLLGGDFWVNINQFAERENPNDPDILQYDIDKPNQIKKQGDQYGYSYKMTLRRTAAWAQLQATLKKFDLFTAAELAHTRFYRTGLNRNGLYPDESFGEAPHQKFTNPSVKGGITYKLNGRNYFFVNAGYFVKAPYFENVYVSPRTRNALQTGSIKNEITGTVEGGYRFNAPQARITVTGFYTGNTNAYDVLTFYHDQFQNFVNYALSGIHSVYFGGELGATIKVSATLSVNAAAAAGRYYYNSRPHAVVTVDNTASVLAEQTVYLQHFRIPSTPQNAYSTGFFYRSPKYWFLSVTGNYFSNSWLSVNPLRRTVEALGDVDPSQPDIQETIRNVLKQERFKDQFTLDLFAGWSKRLPKKYNIHNRPSYLVFTTGVNNILNNTHIRSGGFEQLRFDAENKNIHKFPPKYYYAYGLNYYAILMFRFN